jgi:hypothetical protein
MKTCQPLSENHSRQWPLAVRLVLVMQLSAGTPESITAMITASIVAIMSKMSDVEPLYKNRIDEYSCPIKLPRAYPEDLHIYCSDIFPPLRRSSV